MKREIEQGSLKITIEGPEEIVRPLQLTANLHPEDPFSRDDAGRDRRVDLIGGEGWTKEIRGDTPNGATHWRSAFPEPEVEITVFS